MPGCGRCFATSRTLSRRLTLWSFVSPSSMTTNGGWGSCSTANCLLHGVPEGDGGTYTVDGDQISMTGDHGRAEITYRWTLTGQRLVLVAVEQCAVDVATGNTSECTREVGDGSTHAAGHRAHLRPQRRRRHLLTPGTPCSGSAAGRSAKLTSHRPQLVLSQPSDVPQPDADRVGDVAAPPAVSPTPGSQLSRVPTDRNNDFRRFRVAPLLHVCCTGTIS